MVRLAHRQHGQVAWSLPEGARGKARSRCKLLTPHLTPVKKYEGRALEKGAAFFIQDSTPYQKTM
jgi:hypothetical protein